MPDCKEYPRPVYMLKADAKKYLLTLKLLQELVRNDSLSELGRRIAMGSLIEHAIADITGKPVETAADMQWAMDKAKKLGYIPE